MGLLKACSCGVTYRILQDGCLTLCAVEAKKFSRYVCLSFVKKWMVLTSNREDLVDFVFLLNAVCNEGGKVCLTDRFTTGQSPIAKHDIRLASLDKIHLQTTRGSVPSSPRLPACYQSRLKRGCNATAGHDMR